MKNRPNPAARALGKLRWKNASDTPQEIGRLGGLASRGKSGRPRSEAPRCPCGEMTAKRALARGHKCAA